MSVLHENLAVAVVDDFVAWFSCVDAKQVRAALGALPTR